MVVVKVGEGIGAGVVLGGRRLQEGAYAAGNFVAPTIVVDLPEDHWLNFEELFLPFLSVQRCRTLAEGIARWQMSTGTTLLEGWNAHLGAWIRWLFLGYLVLWSFFTGGALITAAGVAGTGLLTQYPNTKKIIEGLESRHRRHLSTAFDQPNKLPLGEATASIRRSRDISSTPYCSTSTISSSSTKPTATSQGITSCSSWLSSWRPRFEQAGIRRRKRPKRPPVPRAPGSRPSSP